MNRTSAAAYAAFLVVCTVWGTTYLAIAVAVETIPPLVLTSLRFVIAGLLMLALSAWRGEKIPRDARTLGNLALIGFLMVGVGNLAVVWAEQWVPSGLAALFVATAPFWMAVIESVRPGGERGNARTVAGMLVGFVGVGMLVMPGSTGGAWSLNFVLGAVAMQVGCVAWQLGSVHGKYNIRHVPLMTSAALQMLFGGLIVGVPAIALGEASRVAFTARSFAALVYLTIFGSILAYSSYVYVLAHMKTTHSSLYAYVNPVVAMILGWLILDEPLTAMSWIAMGVVLCGVALVQSNAWIKRARDSEPEPLAPEA